MSVTNELSPAAALHRINRTAKPDCRAEVVDGRLTPDLARAAAEQYVATVCQSEDLALLFGSTAQGSARPYSDIDLIIIKPEIELCETRRCMFEGLPIEAHVVDHVGLLRGLAMASRSGMPNVALEVAGAILIFGEADRAAWFQTRAAKAFERGPPPAGSELGAMIARTLTVRLTSLILAPTSAERTALMESCSLLLFQAYFIRNRMWRYTGKWAPRMAPEFAAELEAGFAEVVRDGSADVLVALAERELAAWGGFQWTGTSSVLWPGRLAKGPSPAGSVEAGALMERSTW